MSGFQTRINQQLPIGVEGDFASTNPRASVPPAVGAAWRVAAGQSVRIGYFAWGASDGLVYSSKAAADAVGGAILAFVPRQPNTPSALITTYLGESVMTLSAGMPVTLQRTGDYRISLAGVTPGAAIYATAATGAPSLSAAAGANPDTGYVGASTTKVNAVTNAATTIAAQTGVMSVAVVASGVIEVGQRVTGTGVAANTMITAQLSGTAGGAGTYQTNSLNRAAVAAFTATMVQGVIATISR